MAEKYCQKFQPSVLVVVAFINFRVVVQYYREYFILQDKVPALNIMKRTIAALLILSYFCQTARQKLQWRTWICENDVQDILLVSFLLDTREAKVPYDARERRTPIYGLKAIPTSKIPKDTQEKLVEIAF